MENCIENKIKKLEGYLLSIERNPSEARYEIKLGIPKNWVYKGNTSIECKVISKSDVGVLLLIYSKDNKILLDDLVEFSNFILETNKKIQEKELLFKKEIDKTKKELEERVKSFYSDLEKIKEISFKNLEKTERKIPFIPEEDKSKLTEGIEKKKRGRKPKAIKSEENEEQGK